MEVTFPSVRSKRLFESSAELLEFHGETCARAVMARLADLRAAPTLEEFRHLPGHCYELDEDRRGQLALQVASDKRLVFEPVQKPPPLNGDGALDWRRVDAVRVVEIISVKVDGRHLIRSGGR